MDRVEWDKMMLSISVFIVYILLATVASSDICEEVCICHHQDGVSVLCSSQHISDVPSQIPANITYFDLSRNNLTTLNSDNFHGMPELRALILDHNHIREISPGTFVDLPKLTTLSLSYNDLVYLGDHVFSGLKLQHLNLNHNQHLEKLGPEVFVNAEVETLSMDRCSIRDISPDLFAPVRSSLRYLHWSQSYRPLLLPAGLLQGLPINSLRLSANSITRLDFLNTTSALHIDLSQNQVAQLNVSAYAGLELTESLILTSNILHSINVGPQRQLLHLRDLDVSDNKLTSLDADIFQLAPNLTRLNVTANSLTRLSPRLQPDIFQLSYLGLLQNPFICDCTLNWFLQWASMNKETHTDGDICTNTQDILNDGNCREPEISNIYDQQEKHGFVLLCEATGIPTPNTSWFVNITSHNNYTDFESQLHRTSDTRTISIYIDHIQEETTCVEASCYAQNLKSTATGHISNCYDPSKFRSARITASYNRYLVPVLTTVAVVTLVLALALLVRYIREKLTWKALLYTRDQTLTSEHTLISDIDEEREQVSTETV